MTYTKKYSNGLRLVIQKIEGLFSVSAGVLVKTGSVNESEKENGISHYIEHGVFKGTKNRSSFEISDYIDRIGAQINAFTSKEVTCYYTKSINKHVIETLEILSDLFFNATFDESEMKKEKDVIVEEINMAKDTPEDLLFDLLADTYYGKKGLGQTILGSEKNVRSFTKRQVNEYMNKYYTADNVVISVAGNVNVDEIENAVKNLFADKFVRLKSEKQFLTDETFVNNAYKYKKTEQAHIGFVMPGLSLNDKRTEALSIANAVLGGGMSSRLFQKIREESGLAYSVYSYLSSYKDQGVIEIYAGVNVENRDLAVKNILDTLSEFKKSGINEQEFLRGKEQIKSSLIMGGESTSSQMMLFGKYLLFLDEIFEMEKTLNLIENVTINDVQGVIKEMFDLSLLSTATVGPKKSALKI